MENIRLCSDAGVTLATGNPPLWRRGVVEVLRSGVATYLQKGDDVPVSLSAPMSVTVGDLLSLNLRGVIGT